jgi:3-oxoadipate enol-lactonase
MPTIEINGASIYYEDTGAGSEAIIFAHGLIWSSRMFDAQVASLKDRYRWWGRGAQPWSRRMKESQVR